MKEGPKADVVKRLARLEGQVRGLICMVEEEREPADVLTLVAAIRAALDRVGVVLVTEHVSECLQGASVNPDLSQDQIELRVESVRQALARFVT
jgi:DNA-binding FrmR family transcriptional regulator